MTNYVQRFMKSFLFQKVLTNIFSSASRAVHKLDEQKGESFLNALFYPSLKNQSMSAFAKAYSEDLTLTIAGQSEGTSLKVYNTFIQDFATGKENGTSIIIYISSSIIKFMEITVDKGWIKKRKRELIIDDFQRNEYSADMIIALVADNLLHFIKEDNIPLSPVAITYDLPHWIDQISINRGSMQYWNMEYALLKSFQSEINSLLTSFMKTYGINIDIRAIVESGNAGFMDAQWKNSNCIGGVNMGVETLVCHLERTDKVNLKGLDQKKPYVLLTTDLSNFGSRGELDDLRNAFDHLNDMKSNNPGKKIFEKMTSDKHLGELFRLIVVHMIDDNILLDGLKSKNIMKEFSITTSDMQILEHWERNEAACRALMTNKFGYKRYHVGDLTSLRRLSQYLCDRALRLGAIPLAAIADRSPAKEACFTAYGHLFRQFTAFEVDFTTYVSSALTTNKDVEVMKASKNAALRGAAIVVCRIEDIPYL